MESNEGESNGMECKGVYRRGVEGKGSFFGEKVNYFSGK